MKVLTNTRWALRPLMLATALFSSGLLAAQADDLDQPIGKGVYELAVSPKDNALFVATAQNSSGTVFRLDPTTLAVQQSINTDPLVQRSIRRPTCSILAIPLRVNSPRLMPAAVKC